MQTRMTCLAAILFWCVHGDAGQAQTVDTVPGGSIQTKLSSSIVLNSLSSLQRIWIVIRDPAIPAEFVGSPGVTTIYSSKGSYSGGYEYTGDYKVRSSVDLTAIQVRYLVFDVWGQHQRSLVTNEIEDLPANKVRDFKPRWSLHSEADAATHYASIAYIAKVRTKDNRIYNANLPFVVEQAKKFSAKFDEADLDATPRAK